MLNRTRIRLLLIRGTSYPPLFEGMGYGSQERLRFPQIRVSFSYQLSRELDLGGLLLPSSQMVFDAIKCEQLSRGLFMSQEENGYNSHL